MATSLKFLQPSYPRQVWKRDVISIPLYFLAFLRDASRPENVDVPSLSQWLLSVVQIY